MREKNISSRFRTRACHGIIIIMVWHNNAALYIIKVYENRCCPLRALACPSCARRLPLRMRAAPGEAEGKLWQAWENAGKCGAGGGKLEKNVKKTKKVKKSP